MYHLSSKTIKRGEGRSAIAAAAYRSGGVITDDRTGQSWDYSRKGGVLHTEIIAPAGAPAWAHDRERLWNEVEAREDKSNRRDTAWTAREFEVSLPHQLSQEQREAAGRELGRYLVDTYGVVADLGFHEPGKDGDDRNFHVHILTTTRVMTDAGFGGKVRELDMKTTSGAHMERIREKWAEIGNRHLEAAGFEGTLDHRSFDGQGVERDATEHLGVSASAMERRGEATERGDKNREARRVNELREALKAEARNIEAEITDLAAERTRRAAEKDLRAAVRTFDPAHILDQITERRSTFTRADLNYALSKEITDAKERATMNDAILARPEVVALREREDGPVARYTTRAVLAAERDVLADTAALASDSRHGLTTRQQAEALDRHSHLDQEQRSAFAHLTGPEGIAVLAGEAGTGKSTVLAVVRDAYENAGHRVIGLSWTNSVVEDMRRDGFANASTVASELFRLERGSIRWDARTVLVVDEAAMLSTKHLAALTAKAEAAGAKLIIAGDDHQLASIERGGLFGALKTDHGAAELHNVRRVTGADQQAAFNMMWRGEFGPAVKILDDQGAIRWTETTNDAKAALVAKYGADLAAEPAKSRFAFAYTNAEVGDLNRDIRAVLRERGALGPDHRLETKDGPQDFAAGDRVQFTGSAGTRGERAAGFINGAFGTVRAIDGQRMTVELDSQKNGKTRSVTFNVSSGGTAGEFNAVRHGYAGTIYKGQGKTLDQTYLLHSKHWRETSSYVAATRHRDETSIFVAKDTTRDLAQLARQMGRVDEHRSASQFHHEPVKDLGADRRSDPAENFTTAAREAAGRPGTPSGGDGAAKSPEAATAAPTARQQADAQRKAAIIARIKDPARQAAALYRLHKKDATDRATAGRQVEAPSPARASAGDDGFKRLQDRLAKTAAAIGQREAERPDLSRIRDRGRTR